MSSPAQVFIVDDDAAVRGALAMQLEAAGHDVTTFATATGFLDVCQSGIAGCIILDVDMPGMQGPELQQELIRRGVQLPVIFLTGKGTIPLSVQTMKDGAMDFLIKPVEGSLLLGRVQEALEKNSFRLARAEAHQAAISRLEKLTGREREVMMLIVAGHTSKEIAQRLGISYRTVEIHRAHIMQKTGVANLLELARVASAFEARRTPRQISLPHT